MILGPARPGALGGINSPLITPSGSAVAATMISHTAGRAQATVVEFSTRTGQALRTVTPRASESGPGTWCGVLWAGASGHHLPAPAAARGGWITAASRP